MFRVFLCGVFQYFALITNVSILSSSEKLRAPVIRSHVLFLKRAKTNLLITYKGMIKAWSALSVWHVGHGPTRL